MLRYMGNNAWAYRNEEDMYFITKGEERYTIQKVSNGEVIPGAKTVKESIELINY